MPTPSHLVLASGGLDSTVALLWALHEATEPEAVHVLHINYGTRQNVPERRALKRVLSILGHGSLVSEVTMDLSPSLRSVLFAGGSEDPAAGLQVPMRNALFLSLACGVAVSLDCPAVVFAPHAGDAALFPDCRAAFVDSFQTVANLTHGEAAPRILCPFLDLSKDRLVREAVRLRGVQAVQLLGATFSCYNPETTAHQVHCGACEACHERSVAFLRAGITDPTKYQQSPR